MSSEKEKSLIQRNLEWLEKRGAGAASGSPVLIADDSEADIFFLLRAFATAGVRNPIHVVRSGREAIDYLKGDGKYGDRERYPLPGIVLLDLVMPSPSGMDVLRWKQTASLPRILWVALSNFDSIKTVNEAYASGATTFLSKPLAGDDVRHLIEAFDAYWEIRAASALDITDSRL